VSLSLPLLCVCDFLTFLSGWGLHRAEETGERKGRERKERERRIGA
jgi:hypothetical protein